MEYGVQEYRSQVHYYSKRLKKRLEMIRQFRTTFIEAPSGAGKTTAIQDFFADPEMAGVTVRWFVASEEPPTSGWMRLCGVFNDMDSSTGSRLLALGLPGEENQGEVAQALRELHCHDETYLICDNFQFLQKNLPGAVWRALVNHGGRGLRILFLTQQLSSRGVVVLSNAEVLRIENEDLCLREEEIGEYYHLAGVELNKEQMQNLYRYSEGWMAALYLQLISFIRTGSLERKSSIYELVNELFWEGLPREERERLFRLSPFDTFTVPQACFLLGLESLPGFLGEALSRWMFFRYDLESRRYFPHAIMLDFVRSSLQEEPEPLRREIIYRAGKWCARQGEKTRALNFFYSLQDYMAILSLHLDCADLSRAILDSSPREMLQILRDIVQNATPEMRGDYAFTFISIAFEAFTLGDMELYGSLCGEMRELLESCEMLEDRRRSLLGELELTTSFGFYNDIEGMGKKHERAYELLGTKSRLFQPGSPWTFGWPSVLGMYHSECGSLERKMEQMDYWLPRYNRLTSGNGSGADLLFRADALLHRGFFNEAEALALKALDVTRRWNQDSLYLCTAFLLQRIFLGRGDSEGLEESTSLLSHCASNSVYALSRRIADMAGGFLAVLLNDSGGIPPWIRDGNFLNTLSPAVPFACMIYGRLLLLAGGERELLLRSEEFLAVTRKHKNVLAEIYIILYVAIAQSRMGKNSEGAHSLDGALNLALPDGLILPFAENADLLGSSLKDVLFQRGKRGISGGEKILEFQESYCGGREKIRRGSPEEEIPRGLTQREYEVARLVAEGRTNREIGKELFLSENTVKFYLKSVFQKLEIHSRYEVKKILSQIFWQNLKPPAKPPETRVLLKGRTPYSIWKGGRPFEEIWRKMPSSGLQGKENTRGVGKEMVLIKRVLVACLMITALAMSGGAEVMEPLTFKVGEGASILTVIFAEGALYVMEGTKTVQRIPCDEDTVRVVEEISMELVSPVDMNFDGFLDLQIPESLGSINTYYACYLWNPEKNLFQKNEALEEISSPQFHEDTKEIFSFFHGTATDNVEALYAWRDGRLTMLWRKTQSYEEDSGRFVITEESLKEDGTPGIDFERSFSEEELERYLQGDSGVNEKTRSLMKAASEAIFGTTISGEPRYHGEYTSPEGKHVAAWLVELGNGEMVCFEVPDGDTALYLNKGGDSGTFLINFGEVISLGERLEE